MARKNGDGVAIYVRNHIRVSEKQYTQSAADIEFTVFKLEALFSALIAAVYRPLQATESFNFYQTCEASWMHWKLWIVIQSLSVEILTKISCPEQTSQYSSCFSPKVMSKSLPLLPQRQIFLSLDHSVVSILVSLELTTVITILCTVF